MGAISVEAPFREGEQQFRENKCFMAVLAVDSLWKLSRLAMDPMWSLYVDTIHKVPATMPLVVMKEC